MKSFEKVDEKQVLNYKYYIIVYYRTNASDFNADKIYDTVEYDIASANDNN